MARKLVYKYIQGTPKTIRPPWIIPGIDEPDVYIRRLEWEASDPFISTLQRMWRVMDTLDHPFYQAETRDRFYIPSKKYYYQRRYAIGYGNQGALKFYQGVGWVYTMLRTDQGFLETFKKEFRGVSEFLEHDDMCKHGDGTCTHDCTIRFANEFKRLFLRDIDGDSK